MKRWWKTPFSQKKIPGSGRAGSHRIWWHTNPAQGFHPYNKNARNDRIFTKTEAALITLLIV
jgi:hypothetical protein